MVLGQNIQAHKVNGGIPCGAVKIARNLLNNCRVTLGSEGQDENCVYSNSGNAQSNATEDYGACKNNGAGLPPGQIVGYVRGEWTVAYWGSPLGCSLGSREGIGRDGEEKR
jgi:hypothetical protein